MSNFITKEGLEQMLARRDKINNILLPDITTDINNARDQGDLKENAGFQTALKVRDELIAELAQIDDVLNSDYQLIDDNSKVKDTVYLGSTVKLQFNADKTIHTYKIVGTSESNILEGKISNISALAQAIIGKSKGEIVEYKAASGIIQVKIIEIK